MTNSISFKGTYRAVTTGEFGRKTMNIPRSCYARYPWTTKESVRGAKAYTTGTIDCSVLGISNGQDVLLMHLCPTNPKNNNFKKIKDFILENIDVESKYLEAVLFGSQDYSSKSVSLNKKLLNLMRSLEIPCSIFRCASNEFDVAYSSIEDEWTISSESIDYLLNEKNMSSKDALTKTFKEIRLSHVDEFA